MNHEETTFAQDETSQQNKKIGVLFVCLGNICRSPMAEAVFAHLVQQAGLQNRFEIDSAGTGNWHVGKSAHSQTLEELKRNGIEYSNCARQISPRDLCDFDFIVTMDDENFSSVLRLEKKHGKGRAQIIPLLELTPNIGVREVPDPYFIGGFDVVFYLVQEGCKALLSHIRNEHSI